MAEFIDAPGPAAQHKKAKAEARAAAPKPKFVDAPGPAVRTAPAPTTTPALTNPMDTPGRADTPAATAVQGKVQGALAKAADVFAVPGDIVGAEARDFQKQGLALGRSGSSVDALMADLRRGDFRSAAEDYYWTGGKNLTAIKAGGGPLATAAAAALEHPYVTGFTTFGAEWFNPVNKLPSVFGSVARAGVKGVSRATGIGKAAETVTGAGTPVNAAVRGFSPFRDVRREGGFEAERVTREALRDGEIKQAARKSADAIFQRATRAQRVEIERRAEGLAAKPVPGPPIDMDAAATRLRQTYDAVDREQLSRGLVEPEQLRQNYIPRYGKNVYERSAPTPELREFASEGGGSGRSAGGKAVYRKGTIDTAKVYANYDEAQAGGHLSPNYDPWVNLQHHLISRGKNIALHDALQKFGLEMRREGEWTFKGAFLGHGAAGEAQAMRIAGRLARGEALSKVEQTLGVTRADVRGLSMSDPLKRTFVQMYRNAQKELLPQKRAMMQRQTERDMAKAYGMAPATDKLDALPPSEKYMYYRPGLIRVLRDARAPQPEKGAVLAWFDTLNKLARVGIITNPVIHVGWNLLWNYLGDGGDIRALPAIMAGRAASPQMVERARAAGALVIRGGHEPLFPHLGSEGDILAGPATFSKAGMAERGVTGTANRLASKAWEANQRLVFDHFETQFAAKLFERKVAQGMSDAEAGIAVRKALGDYQNVSATGLEAILNRAFFFYPWMKTVVPFWARTAYEKPQFVNAPVRAIESVNQIQGDPGTSNPFTVNLGHDARGRAREFTLPFPQRVANMMAEAATHNLGPSMDYVRGHFNPAIATIVDLAQTTGSAPSLPGGANFHTMYDKQAPPAEKARAIASYLAGGFIYPLREGGQVVKDPTAALQILPGGFYHTQSDTANKMGARIEHRFRPLISQLHKAGRDAEAARYYEMMLDYLRRYGALQ